MNIPRIFALLWAISSIFLCAGQEIIGDWTGELNLGPGRSLKLVLHITHAAFDETSSVSQQKIITMDSPDQGAYGLECETVFISSDSVSVAIPHLGMKYSGKCSGNILSGIFRQGTFSLPLTFNRGAVKVNRPQTPQSPYPYTQEEVIIPNPGADGVLGATLVIPENRTRKTPVVILVTGSGLQNRDEELFEHKPFAVIADNLARNGIASLRYDDRGVGESTGSNDKATTQDYANDARTILDWVKKQKRFGKTGIIGHSEGGTIATILGAQKNGPDFVVSIAGPSIPGWQILDYQNRHVLTANGVPEAQARTAAIQARERIQADSTKVWMNYFLSYDPAQALAALKIPTFIIYGEKDTQVPPSLNFQKAQTLCPKALVRVYPGLNHLMQHAATGEVAEYGKIEETIAPEVLSDIVSFIHGL